MSQTTERRRYSRLELNLPVTVCTSDGQRVEGRLADLSSGGVSVQLSQADVVLQDEAVEVEMQFGSPGQLVGPTSIEPGVVRYRREGRVGIEFNRLRMGQVA